MSLWLLTWSANNNRASRLFSFSTPDLRCFLDYASARSSSSSLPRSCAKEKGSGVEIGLFSSLLTFLKLDLTFLEQKLTFSVFMSMRFISCHGIFCELELSLGDHFFNVLKMNLKNCLIWAFHQYLYNKHYIAWPLGDTNFIIGCKRIILSIADSISLRSLVKDTVSQRGHIISSIII